MIYFFLPKTRSVISPNKKFAHHLWGLRSPTCKYLRKTKNSHTYSMSRLPKNIAFGCWAMNAFHQFDLEPLKYGYRLTDDSNLVPILSQKTNDDVYTRVDTIKSDLIRTLSSLIIGSISTIASIFWLISTHMIPKNQLKNEKYL